MLAVIGTDAPEAGFSIVVSHIDSPRLDLKQRPLYETAGHFVFQDALLRRHQKVPVDGAAAGAASGTV